MEEVREERRRQEVLEREQRQKFCKNLAQALGPLPDEDQGTFAACGIITPSPEFSLRSLHVEGAGELALPLSAEGTSRLRRVCEQAPFGRGLATLVDTNVRCCWQVDASKVSFPGTPTFISDMIQPLATMAVRLLGIDGEVQLEAHLYKLLLYEAGGHFTSHRDTEKLRGMFGTLILQLPTEEGYKGGELIVELDNEVKKFDCQTISKTGFCCTVFFADCLHKLQRIETGSRLCLTFNLTKGNSASETILRGFISRRLQNAEVALIPWLRAATERKLNFIGAKLAIPLQHKYSETNLSFAGLKGEDKILAEVLKNCRDEDNEKWLDLHLCLVTWYQRGTPSSPYHSDSGREMSPIMGETIEDETNFKLWIGLDDRPSDVHWIPDVYVDLDNEVVVEQRWENCPFDENPDEKNFEYTGNAGPTLEFLYHAAILVIWPIALSISVLSELDIFDALKVLEKTQNTDPEFRGQLHQVVHFCQRHERTVWNNLVWSKDDSVTPRLLQLCTRAGLLEDVIQIIQLLAKVFDYRLVRRFGEPVRYKTYRIGVRNAEVANAIATVVQKFGWGSVSSVMLDLAKHCALIQGESYVQLAKQLISMGNRYAAKLVANTVFDIFGVHIAQLESLMPPEPIFNWCQPRARLPEYPGVERFLRGPREKYRLEYFDCIADARRFVQKYCKTNDTYSVFGKYYGRGHKSFCVITKTSELFDIEKENWRIKQEELKTFKLALGKFRSAIPEISAIAVTTSPNQYRQLDREGQRSAIPRTHAVTLSPSPYQFGRQDSERQGSTISEPNPVAMTISPNQSGQQDSENQCDDTTRDTVNRMTKNSNRQVLSDVTLNSVREVQRVNVDSRKRLLHYTNKRAKSTSNVDFKVNTVADWSITRRPTSTDGAIEFVDLTEDEYENHLPL